METFGDLLRRYRLAAGLTQEELAEKAQVSPRAISDLERGQRRHPWRDTVQLLATALDLEPSERAQLDVAARRTSSPSAETSGRAPPFGETVVQTNLPVQVTSFVGRAKEIVAVGELLRRPDVHLVTLTGPGGIGKPRLALQVAAYLLNN